MRRFKTGLTYVLAFLMVFGTFNLQPLSIQEAAAAAETVSFPAVQDAFVSNFSTTQADSLGITLNANKLIYGKFRHAYLKFDLSSINTERYDINEMNMILSFRKTHAPNELVFTESDSTLRDSGEPWTINNLTYNTRPNDVAESPVVTVDVTSTGEENLTIDLSTIFRFALSNGRKVVSIHLTTARVNDSAVSASEMYSSRNTAGQPGPSLAVTLGDPIVNDGTDKTALNSLIDEANSLIEADYTASSWAVFAEALQQAIEVSGASTTQDEVDQAFLLLQTAKNNLAIAELPSKITGPNMGNYYNNSTTASKIIKMKNGEGQYVKVDPITEKLSLTANAAEASAFALYVLDYFATVDHVEPEVGATRTAYSIKSLDNDKYLTIQNYYQAEEFLSNTHRYFNILSGAPSGISTDRTFEIKASASIPNWNERFYVDQYAKSGYYRIYSHLSTMRDDLGFDRFNVRMTDDSMLSTGTIAENTEYRFYWEEVTGRDQLEVSQEVTGDNAELFWPPVNGDTNPANYSVDGKDAGIVFADGLMRLTLPDLSVGDHAYEVDYTGNGYQAKAEVNVRIFSHPGILQTMEDLEKMKLHVQSKEEPWYSDYQRLMNSVSYNLSSFDYETTVFSNVGRGGAPSDSANIGYFEKAGNAAYFNALQWVITGDNQYAANAADILSKWANALKVIDGRDRILGAGINAYKYASAAEIIRYYNGGYNEYSDEDFKALQDMMINVVYPVIQDAAAPMLANGNWDAAALVSMMSIGVLCDNTEIFDRAMAFYQDIHVNGSIFAYVHESGQTMETGRDQAHALLAIGYMAEICLIANNQDEDLYSLYDNRLAKAFEYSAKYNLYSKELYGEDVPFVAMPNVFGDTGRGYYGAGFDRENNGLNRGELRPVFEQALALYSKVSGVDMTWTARAAAAARPQAMVHFDNLNFGTLTHYNGEPLNSSGPYFQLRTRWEPLYQRNWSIVDDQRVAETLNSYYDMNEHGELMTSVMKKDAPFYQLVTNDDGTYSIRLVKTNTYLSVKDDKVDGYNVIKADATEIGENEKFMLRSTGVGPFFLVSPKYDNRIVYQHAAGSGSSAVLTLRLGTKNLSQVTDIPNVSTNERLIFMYNTKEIAQPGAGVPDGVVVGGTSETPEGRVEVGNGEIVIKPITDDKGTAAVELNADSVKKALAEAKDGSLNIRAMISDQTEQVKVTIPIDRAAVGKEVKRVEVDTGLAVISVSAKLISENAPSGAKSMAISVKKADVSNLPEDTLAQLGGAEVFDLHLEVNGKEVSEFGGKGDVRVELNYTLKPDERLGQVVIYYINASGELEVVHNGKYDPVSGKVGFKPAHFSQYAAAYKEVRFSDVTGGWAKEAIEALGARGIVNGFGDGTFRPDSQVTRAEFLAMLLNGFGLTHLKASSSFSDVPNDAWYADEVAAAVQLGIVNGRADGTFGAEASITREEMSVMAYRAAKAAGLTFDVSEGVTAFTDQEQVAAYSQEAVATMQAANVIQGMGNGLFSPHGTATRDQAAAIIYRLIGIL